MKKLLLPIILSLVICLPGCTASMALMLIGPVVQGFIMWENGEGHKYYQYNYKIMHRASKKALKILELPIISEKITDNECYIIAGSKSQYKIRIFFVENSISDVRVRINFIGNKQEAELIYSNLDKAVFMIDYDKDGNPY